MVPVTTVVRPPLVAEAVIPRFLPACRGGGVFIKDGEVARWMRAVDNTRVREHLTNGTMSVLIDCHCGGQAKLMAIDGRAEKIDEAEVFIIIAARPFMYLQFGAAYLCAFDTGKGRS